MFGCNMSYTHRTDVLYRVRVFVCEIGKRITPDHSLRGFLYHTVWWPSTCLLNLAIQDVASMAAKTCSLLGSLCKQYFILQLYSL